MPGSFIIGMSRLEKVIEDLRRDLERYSQKPDANDKFIQMQNQVISNLVIAFNDLDTLQYAEVWESIEDTIDRIERIDPELNAHNILIQTRPGTLKCSRIAINPFER